MEYCQGPDLGLCLRQNGPLSEEFSRIIIYQLLNALKYLNDLDEKIIHYDLKPEIIIFVSDVKIKITDFGLSKIIDSNKDYIQMTSYGVGTYWHFALECFENNQNSKITRKVDIWSL